MLIAKKDQKLAIYIIKVTYQPSFTDRCDADSAPGRMTKIGMRWTIAFFVA